MNYETATDKELEIRLTSLVYNLDGWEVLPMGTMFFHCGIDGSGFYEQSVIDYCTDWNATMPLSVEHKVSLIPSINEDYYRAIPVAGEIVHDKNPLRAIVICLIKVLESK